MANLKEDIFSMFKKGHLYGKAGERVKVISGSDVLIVENIKGERYPVIKEKVLNA